MGFPFGQQDVSLLVYAAWGMHEAFDFACLPQVGERMELTRGKGCALCVDVVGCMGLRLSSQELLFCGHSAGSMAWEAYFEGSGTWTSEEFWRPLEGSGVGRPFLNKLVLSSSAEEESECVEVSRCGSLLPSSLIQGIQL